MFCLSHIIYCMMDIDAENIFIDWRVNASNSGAPRLLPFPPCAFLHCKRLFRLGIASGAHCSDVQHGRCCLPDALHSS